MAVITEDSNTIIQPGDTFVITHNQKLYARWTADWIFSIAEIQIVNSEDIIAILGISGSIAETQAINTSNTFASEIHKGDIAEIQIIGVDSVLSTEIFNGIIGEVQGEAYSSVVIVGEETIFSSISEIEKINTNDLQVFVTVGEEYPAWQIETEIIQEDIIEGVLLYFANISEISSIDIDTNISIHWENILSNIEEIQISDSENSNCTSLMSGESLVEDMQILDSDTLIATSLTSDEWLVQTDQITAIENIICIIANPVDAFIDELQGINATSNQAISIDPVYADILEAEIARGSDSIAKIPIGEITFNVLVKIPTFIVSTDDIPDEVVSETDIM
jgi:hypothetical protein